VQRHNMGNILNFAGEILDNIIDHVLLDEAAPLTEDDYQRLTAANSHGEGGRTYSTRATEVWKSCPPQARHYSAAWPANSAALLRINRLFHDRTELALRRLFPNGTHYKLDALLVRERQIWPLWLKVPTLSTSIHTVDVTFRVFEANNSKSSSMWRRGCGGPPQWVWIFYNFLRHFANFGPCSFIATKEAPDSQRRHVTVQTLNLNFVNDRPEAVHADDSEAHADWRERQRWGAGRRPRRRNGAEADEEPEKADKAIHPRYLANGVINELRFLSRMGYHGASYGGFIFEHIGTVNVLFDGEAIDTIDYGATLAKLAATPDRGREIYTQTTFRESPGQCRVLAFWAWKKRVVKRRKELGLPVPDDVEWPSQEQVKEWRRLAEHPPPGDRSVCYGVSHHDQSGCACDEALQAFGCSPI